MNSPLSPNPLTSVEVPPRTQADLTQIMLRFASLSDAEMSNGAIAHPNPVSSAIVSTTQQVMRVIQELRSPDSGWPGDIPQTPENLAPYVAEEVYDVIDALQSAPPVTAQPDARWHEYSSLQSLLPWLLWAIARSSYEVMRLIEGVPAECFEGHQRQSGILRLSTRLDIAAPDFSATLDLATQQAPANTVPATVQLRSEACSLCQEAIAADVLLEHINQQVKLTTPVLNRFFEGLNADFLVPQQPWQTGVIWLQLGFEFVPTGVPVAESFASPPNPTLQFTETDWLEDYAKMVVQRQMQDAIAQLPEFRAVSTSPTDRDALVPKLVEDACHLMEWLQSPVAQSNQNFLRRNLSLTDFSRWILWCLSRSTYEITQLVGGVQATLLQPGASWQSGTLRLLAALRLKTVEHDWYLDLGTGQALPYALESVPVPPDSLVQSGECAWCQRPDLFHRLHSEVMANLQQTTPELQLLMEGTGIDMAESDHWEPGALQLTVTLEFMPDKPLTL